MGRKHLLWQKVDNTGEVLGQPGTPVAGLGVAYHGFHLNNTDSSDHTVTFYAPAAQPGSGNVQTTVPSASSPNVAIAVITVKANTSKEFYVDEGVYFKDGLFLIASDTHLTGLIFYS